MRRAGVTAVLVAALTATACVENTAPGNDREAALDAVAPPASTASASEALSNVDPGLLMPEIIPPADLGTLPQMEGACRFRMTEVGFPVVVYGSRAVVKLNGKLIPLPEVGEGHYADAGVDVTVRPLDAGADRARPFDAEFVLRLEGAPNELGFHGVAECASG